MWSYSKQDTSLDLFFFYIYTRTAASWIKKIYLCSFIVLALEHHSMNIRVTGIRLQMLPVLAEQLLLSVFFLFPPFRNS